jgi:hypothetical protein
MKLKQIHTALVAVYLATTVVYAVALLRVLIRLGT